jgi:hypothetical protein
MDTMPNEHLPLNSAGDWPYGFGVCCCGCGKKAREVGGVLQKFYRKYHERWLRERNPRFELPRPFRERKRRVELPRQPGAELSKYPINDEPKRLPEAQKTTRPNKYAIAKHLPDAFRVSQSKINRVYSNNDRGSPTAREREEQFPHLNAPTIELANRFKKADTAKSNLGSSISTQPELLGTNETPDRLREQLAWTKANQSLLEAISRARDRVDIAVKGAYIRNREKADVEFCLLQRIRSRMGAVLRGKARERSTLRLIGCSLPELKAHLEGQFKTGMAWSNYGEWHVDHVRPCASFDFSDPTSLSLCFHYTNLQPMWGQDNIKKNSRWEGKLVRRKNQK